VTAQPLDRRDFRDRLGALDRVADDLGEPDASLSDDLFSVVAALDSSPALRRALTDPSTPGEARTGMVRTLLAGKVGDPALELTAQACTLRWRGGRRLAEALERQGIRAELTRAQRAGSLDEVEDELFRFSRLVDSNPDLRSAIADRGRELTDRQGLVAGLLEGQADEVTVRLVRRAVAARDRTFALTVAGYVDLAARLRGRAIATVRVARSLDPDQLERLRNALSQQAGRDLSIQQVIDPDVVGGVRVELGDEVVEGTVAGRIEEARRLFGG